MKTFLIRTDYKDEKWQTSQGIYLINAEDEEEARGMWSPWEEWAEYKEVIDTIEEINITHKRVFHIESPSVM